MAGGGGRCQRLLPRRRKARGRSRSRLPPPWRQEGGSQPCPPRRRRLGDSRSGVCRVAGGRSATVGGGSRTAGSENSGRRGARPDSRRRFVNRQSLSAVEIWAATKRYDVGPCPLRSTLLLKNRRRALISVGKPLPLRRFIGFSLWLTADRRRKRRLMCEL